MSHYLFPVTRCLFAILLFGLAIECFAVDGELDPSFGVGGIVNITYGEQFEPVVDVAIQADGKSVEISTSDMGYPNTTWRSVVGRFLVDGAIDTSFGTNGSVFFSNLFPSEIVSAADGKILVAGALGRTFSDSRFYLARLNSDGTFDTSFNSTGTVILDVGYIASSVELQTDGKIVATAPERIVRFHPDGTLDRSFGNGGILVAPFGSSDLKIQPDGKFVGAETALDGSLPVFSTFPYNSDGSVDTTFGDDGVVLTRFIDSGTNPYNFVSKLALEADGKIVVVGIAGSANSFYSSSIALARFNGDGSLDPSFGTGGKALVSYSIAELSANDIAIQADNKILVAARVYFVPKISNFAVLRLNPNGDLDPTFNGDGWFIYTQSIFGGGGQANAVAIQANGKIIAGGDIRPPFASPYTFTLVRLTNSSATGHAFMDFDGDGKTDLSVFRGGTWFVNQSHLGDPGSYYGVQFGLPDDKLAPADFDGDRKTDIAVWRENVNGPLGYFFILQSSTNTVRAEQFGTAGDDPRVVGDRDGDGTADISVYRNGAAAGEQSYFYYRPSSQPLNGLVTVPWGITGDEPLRGDFDGDGRMDAAVFRASDLTWYILQSSNSEPRYAYSGIATDKRVSGDFDGDGKRTLRSFETVFGLYCKARVTRDSTSPGV
jgi:uncharacterized delta-60 repeat protein